MITPATPIIGTGGTRTEVLAFLLREFKIVPSSELWNYLTELERLCLLTGIRFDVACAQSYLECFNPDTGKPWDSERFVRNRNPAGLAVESDDDPDPATFTGIEAARVHVWALLEATDQPGFSDGTMLPDSALPFMARWRAKYNYHACPTVVTIADLQRRYVEEEEWQATFAWDDQYAVKLCDRANAIFGVKQPGESDTTNEPSKGRDTMPTLVFGNVPDPGIKQMICAKPYDGAGFTRVAPRQPVGVCEHITAGRGSAQWYSDFFATGGERQYDALVDFVVDRTGTIGMLNDPWGTRSPWANGRTDGLEGDGPAFLAKFGINGVNDRLISIEHEGMPADVWPQAQWEASVKLTAYLYDRMKVRWDSFPVHQDYGVVTHMLHSEFTGKGGNALDECPGRYLKGRITQFQSEVRNYMKSFQVGAEVPAEPLPKPEPVTIYPAGMDLGIARTLFGKLRKHQVGKPTTAHGFNPNGGVSLAWLERGANEGQFPQGGDWYTFEEERELIVFTNGWVLWRPSKRAGWRWVGDAADVKAA